MIMRWTTFFLISLGVLVFFMGALPFLQNILPETLKIIPSAGDGYSLIIIFLGLLISVIAFRARRPRIKVR